MPDVTDLRSLPEVGGGGFLSQLLSSLRVDSATLVLFDFGAPWGIKAGDLPIPISLTVMEGELWLISPQSNPVVLHRGDTVLLPRGVGRRPYAIASSLDVKPVPAKALFEQAQLGSFVPGQCAGRVIRLQCGGQGPRTRIMSMAFGFDVGQLGPLEDALPEEIVVRASDSRYDYIDPLLRTLMEEEDDQPGFAALALQAAQTLLIHAVRSFVRSRGPIEIGWLASRGDLRIARALICIHRDPGNDWTLANLAREAGLSRSAFAKQFLARMGQTPMQYLRAWRMHLARDALARHRTTVTALALNLGYLSEAAFRTAFRDATGFTPREYRRSCRAKAIPNADRSSDVIE